MHILVADNPVGPLTDAISQLTRRGVQVTVVPTLSALMTALRSAPCDAVVAGVLPDLDAATALTLARLKQPAAVRIAVKDGLMGQRLEVAVEAAHHLFDAIPTSAEVLDLFLRRIALSRPIPDRLNAVIGGAIALPSTASILDELRGVVADPTSGTDAVSRILSSDPGLSGKVLHLANAGFVRPNLVIGDLHQAAALLGLQTLERLVTASVAFGAAEELGADPEVVATAQQHGEAAARAAFQLGLTPPQVVGALMMDVGLPLMSLAWPEHRSLERSARRQRAPLHHAELEVFGVTHADAGAVLADRWSLPGEIAEVVVGHHAVTHLDDEEMPIGALLDAVATSMDAGGHDRDVPVGIEIPAWAADLLGEPVGARVLDPHPPLPS